MVYFKSEMRGMQMSVKDRLLEATASLMRCHGVSGTSLSDILSTSGVARRSIYLNFPGGKSELVTEATRASGAIITQAIEGILDSPDPISAFSEMWVEVLTSTDFDAGCPVVAAALGRADAPSAADLAGGIFGQWHDLVRDRMVDDGIDADIAKSLAITIVSAIEGAVIASQAQHSTRPLTEVAIRLRELVALHLSAVPSLD